MELILVILFFAISSAICLKMFAHASLTAQNAENLSYASLSAGSVAECYKVTDGDLTELAEILDASLSGDTLQITYDEQWKNSPDGKYVLSLHKDGNYANIEVSEAGKSDVIFALTVASIGGES